MSTVTWYIGIDWDDDGTYEDNAAAKCRSLSVERGRTNFLYINNDGVASAFEPVRVGRCSFVLDNQDGDYNPYNVYSPNNGLIAPGKFVQIKAIHDGTTDFVFSGTIKDIRPNFAPSGDWTVNISCVDGMQFLADAPAQNTTSIYTNLAVSECLNTLFATTDLYPARWGTNIESSTDFGNLTYFWLDKRPLDTINELTEAHVGQFFVAADGRATFFNREHVYSSPIVLTSDQIGRDLTISMPWETKRDNIIVWSNTLKTSTDVVLYSVDDEIFVEAGATEDIWVNYATSDNVYCSAINVVATTDYTANTAQDGSGTNLTGSFAISFDDLADTAKITVANGSTDDGYLTGYTLRGDAIIPAQRFYIQSGTGSRQFVMDNRYIWGNASAKAKIQQILDRCGTDRAFPTITIQGRNEVQWDFELFDLVTATINFYVGDRDAVQQLASISGSFLVGYIRHEWTHPTGQAARTILRLEPIESFVTENVLLDSNGDYLIDGNLQYITSS